MDIIEKIDQILDEDEGIKRNLETSLDQLKDLNPGKVKPDEKDRGKARIRFFNMDLSERKFKKKIKSFANKLKLNFEINLLPTFILVSFIRK